MGTSSTVWEAVVQQVELSFPSAFQLLCQAGADVEGVFCVGHQDLCPHPHVRFAAQQPGVGSVALQRVQVIEVGYPAFIFYFGIYF